MYKIIGGDQKEYGPVTAADIRQWIIEGRANGQTLILVEGTADWKPLSDFPEFADALVAIPPVQPMSAGNDSWTPEGCLARDYQLDILGYFARTWQLLNQHLGLFLGATAVVIAVTFLFEAMVTPFVRPATEAISKSMESVEAAAKIGDPQKTLEAMQNVKLEPRDMASLTGGMLAAIPFQAVLQGGMSFFLLNLIRRRKASVFDVMAGFGRSVLMLAITGLLCVLPWFACCCFVIPGVYLMVAWSFAIPLVIDKRLNCIAALELSRQRVHRHWLSVFCLWLLVGLISSVGAVTVNLAMAVAATSGPVLQLASFFVIFLITLVTFPMAYGLRLHAYEDIFKA